MNDFGAGFECLVFERQFNSVDEKGQSSEVIMQSGSSSGKADFRSMPFRKLSRILSGLPAEQESAPLISFIIRPGSRLTVGTTQNGQCPLRHRILLEPGRFLWPCHGPFHIGNKASLMGAIPNLRYGLGRHQPANTNNTYPGREGRRSKTP